MKARFVALALILVLATSQSCEMSLDERAECGYMGIDQSQC